MKTNNKKILFFFVHPSKYHLFKHSINKLKSNGFQVDIAIIKKDVLEDLIKNEGWKYTNIFPEGRKSNPKLGLFGFLINAIKTLFRLYNLTKSKKYDLYISDDLLIVLSKIQRVTSLFVCDDDFKYIKELIPIFSSASKILSPKLTNLEKYENKKISYNGLHELSYLHPMYFTPDKNIIKDFNPDETPYAIIRLVSLTASHDIGKKGINNNFILELIELISPHLKIFISSERPLIDDLEKYRLKIKPQNILSALYFSDLFIGDSQTMTTEAAILGVPAIRYNSFVGQISTLNELESKYQLTFGFKPGNENKLKEKIIELLNMQNRKEVFQVRRKLLIEEKEDTNEVLYNTITKLTSDE